MTKAILVEAVKRRSAVQKLTVAFSGKCGLGQMPTDEKIFLSEVVLGVAATLIVLRRLMYTH